MMGRERPSHIHTLPLIWCHGGGGIGAESALWVHLRLQTVSGLDSVASWSGPVKRQDGSPQATTSTSFLPNQPWLSSLGAKWLTGLKTQVLPGSPPDSETRVINLLLV